MGQEYLLMTLLINEEKIKTFFNYEINKVYEHYICLMIIRSYSGTELCFL